MRRFKKIKIGKVDYTFVYDNQNDGGMWEGRSLSSSEPPRPEFDCARKELAYCLTNMCQLDIERKDIPYSVAVNEVRYTYPSEKPAHLIIKGSAYLKNGHVLKVTSPAWEVPNIHSSGWDKGLFDALSWLEDEAWKYVDGERAQGVLFKKAENEEAENPMIEEDDDT